VLKAAEEGRDCPYCGLSASAAEEIRTIREARADQALRDRCEQLIKENADLQWRLRWAKTRLLALNQSIVAWKDRLDKPLESEKQPEW
jgi:hypothetical protein